MIDSKTSTGPKVRLSSGLSTMSLEDFKYILQRECSSSETTLHQTSSATCSLDPTQQMKHQGVYAKVVWIKGPDFLSWQTKDHWPQQDSYENEVDHNSPDVRKVTANATVIEEHEKNVKQIRMIFQVASLKGRSYRLYGIQTTS